MKKCARCRNLKDEKEFINDKGKVVKKCIKCREYDKRYNEDNADKLKSYREAKVEEKREYDRLYSRVNSDKKREYDKNYRKENYNRIKELKKVYYRKNEDEINFNSKRYYKANREQRSMWSKEHYIQNRQQIRDQHKEYNSRPAKYETYARALTVEESPVQGVDGGLLVKCAKCKTYYTPTNLEVRNRVSALEGKRSGECRLYCSQECKDSCEIYWVKNDPYAEHAQLERDPQWARRIKKAAKYTCERCGSKENLEAHHEIPVKVDQSLVNDEMNGICLCHECHMKAHSESGCTLADLRNL